MQQSAEDVSESIPLMIGRYRIEKLLGTGGFGRVYLAMDEKLDRKIAIKVSHAKTAASPRQLAFIQYESKTVASLDHPNVVPIYDVGSSDEFPIYLVTKYIDGHNLARELHAGITQAQAVEWTIQIAEALAYAHEKGVIHRDVKPHNILIDTNGHARLTDFGLAWRSTDDRAEYPNAGTPAYMSPEQRTIGRSVDHRTDIYSLGLVLKELLDEADNMGKSTIFELSGICLQAMAERPNDRFATANDFARCLRHYAANQGWSSLPHTLNSLQNQSQAMFQPWRVFTSWRSWLAVATVLILTLAINYWRISEARTREIALVDSLLASVPSELSQRLKFIDSISQVGLTRLRSAAVSGDIQIRIRAQLALLRKTPELAEDVAMDMLNTPFELATVVGKELLPHKDIGFL